MRGARSLPPQTKNPTHGPELSELGGQVILRKEFSNLKAWLYPSSLDFFKMALICLGLCNCEEFVDLVHSIYLGIDLSGKPVVTHGKRT